MTPHRNRGRGTLVLDRQWRGVRLSRASGTNDPKTLGRLERMLDDLQAARRFDLWLALAGGEIHPLDLYDTYRLKGLQGLQGMREHMEPLKEALDRWLVCARTRRGKALAETTIMGYRACLDAVTGVMRLGETVQDLPSVLRRYRGERAPAGMFGQARVAALSFARQHAGKSSALYRQIEDIEPLAERAKGDRRGRPVEEVRQIAAALGQYGPVWWALCCTGMRVKNEYLTRRWRVEGDRVVIWGTKTAAALRFVPLLSVPPEPFCAYTTLPPHFRAAGVTAHEARYTFRHWLDEAGIPPARRAFYMGHSESGTNVYGRHDAEPYLPQDRRQILELLGGNAGLLRAVR